VLARMQLSCLFACCDLRLVLVPTSMLTTFNDGNMTGPLEMRNEYKVRAGKDATKLLVCLL
jgi:hypothetical protein